MELRLEDFNLRSVCVDLLKNFWVILLAVLAAWFGIAGVYQLRYVPEYTASATVAVSSRGNSGSVYSSLSLTNEMAGVLGEVFQSDALKNTIMEDLGWDHFNGELGASVIDETNLLILSATSPSPRETYLMIQSALENYDTVSEYLFSNARLDMVKEASVPQSPSNVQNIRRIQKIGMLGAGGLTAAAIALFSFFRLTVKTRETARRQLDGHVLGTIPYERKNRTLKAILGRRRKKALLISSSLHSMAFSESVRRISTVLEHHMKRRGQKILMVTSAEENEGKSSVAANLALALAEKGKKVLLVDGDMRKPALYKIFDRPKETGHSLSEFLEGQCSIQDVITREKSGIFTVLQYHGIRRSGRDLNGEKMKTFLQQCRGLVDYIIIDTPPMNLATDAEIILGQVDAVALVVRQDWSDIGVINDISDVVTQSGADFAGYILNAFHREYPWQRMTSSYGYYGYQSKQDRS